MYILGFDIGGTKCAVITAEWDGQEIKLLKKDKCATDHRGERQKAENHIRRLYPRSRNRDI